MKKALISVSDKTKVAEFAKGLIDNGFEILSTGGTLKHLQNAKLEVKSIDEYTSFPEMLDGRVKTLHPKIHGGLLGVRDNENHIKQMKNNDIEGIDLVCVNLYPFKENLLANQPHEVMVEKIDIGGPSMLRSAAKNYKFVTVVTKVEDYNTVLKEIKENGNTKLETRAKLAAKVFSETAAYDSIIANYLIKETGSKVDKKTITFELQQELRYGENSHQEARWYKGVLRDKLSLTNAKQLWGKELSYNNIQDANSAVEIISEFGEMKEVAVVALKHMNPCGIGLGKTAIEAWEKAYSSDSVSIFGGIIAMNEPVTIEVAEKISKIFLEIVIAPKFEKDAFELLTKKKNIRLLTMGLREKVQQSERYVSVGSDLLIQQADTISEGIEDYEVVTKIKPSKEDMKQLDLAWKAIKNVKSNAILLWKNGGTIGIGAGQMNRLSSTNIAIEWAGDKVTNSFLSSDAFFPMPDSIENAAKAGIKAIIQPGGSIKDKEVIEAADKHGIIMVFTKKRHFKH
ncbi:bifunctional phosphoribosylaminoimidazolecarboxamide formyltransferase/IMP cyclohydrolase [Mycoplasma todarodis]|uniref:Bifunctional purine biosynthesis protein PurH n=1 Tax=Mycoplasma todarodis TaxID=1937191 RepID=A0A4R0XTX7_9MOLU|nr:bifunctional phosphoribosylaminoimidazolecarboxamide formyltransferase/IMP cyclohydrolase [Mycoplasma todarodis]TCG11109.1 bifunctional phosphoribosylaminoimidazolecarboxamide formyltransferase/inosine monophosphate cyclohydrolase [Mycoplasma todarodis]